MKNTCNYLDDIKNKENLTSDYQLAHYLDISQAAISRYRNKKSTLDNYTALRVAAALDINPLEVIAIVSAERSKVKKEKNDWIKLAKKIEIACLMVVMTITLSAQSERAVAKEIRNDLECGTMYIMLNVRKWLEK